MINKIDFQKIIEIKFWMYLFIFLLFNLNFGTVSNANELILVCKMNYGISGENDETDIEFKNLSIIDEDLVVFLNIEKNGYPLKVKEIFKRVVEKSVNQIF